MTQYAQLTKPGGRKVNEDSISVAEGGGTRLFALADGLGGHSGGDIASQCVVKEALEVFDQQPGCDLATVFNTAQDALMELQQKRGQTSTMKSTLVLLALDDKTARCGHIGDSRLYVFDGGKVLSRTRDHSVPQMLVMSGEIKEKDIRFHPDRNRLLRVMGVEWESPRYELSDLPQPAPGTAYLLCTDGFWEYIDEDAMCKELKAAQSPQAWLDAMEKRVLRAGKGHNMDNYSAIAVMVK
uniref:Protein serine/threonine phosphatase PrpC, regulation of stationary phase n=1 Tax=uncultured bacterium contig00040 TaxID=1181528 RepID=A0A806KJJ1_9BACT|nr:protein serine/threonine phosphatase PrpC, regulation of stationary phase [uncultured bacterium contig00040]